MIKCQNDLSVNKQTVLPEDGGFSYQPCSFRGRSGGGVGGAALSQVTKHHTSSFFQSSHSPVIAGQPLHPAQGHVSGFHFHTVDLHPHDSVFILLLLSTVIPKTTLVYRVYRVLLCHVFPPSSPQWWRCFWCCHGNQRSYSR